MKILRLSVILIVLLFTGCSSAPVISPPPATSPGADGVAISGTTLRLTTEKVSERINNDSGTTLAEMRFDKPVLSGSSDAAKKINAYFAEECHGFFSGSKTSRHFMFSSHKQFFMIAASVRTSVGDVALALKPLQNTVTTQVVYSSPDVLSILETAYWYDGGPSFTYYYGSTFDLKTGELLPISHFVKTDLQTLNDRSIALLYNYFKENPMDGTLIPSQFEQKHHRYTFEDYEYYVDGQDVFLIFRELHQYETSYIIKYTPK